MTQNFKKNPLIGSNPCRSDQLDETVWNKNKRVRQLQNAFLHDIFKSNYGFQISDEDNIFKDLKVSAKSKIRYY
jgi:hypothetical protein